MEKRDLLREALDTWTDWQIETGQVPSGGHVPGAELYELLVHPASAPDREDLLNHLQSCPVCLGELKLMAQAIKEAQNKAPLFAEALGKYRSAVFDRALLSAAASRSQGYIKLIAEEGKYSIEIIPHLTDKNRGLIVLMVLPPFLEQLEGRTIVLKDARERVLLQGVITDGKIAQKIDNLAAIEYGLEVHSA